MKLCNYNWNVMALGILQDYEISTTEMYVYRDEGLERFNIGNSIGYDVWLKREIGGKKFIYTYCEFIGGDPDVFTVHYYLDSKDKEMGIEFYGSGW
jgi:hypothetical protein